nr:hypothetical protein [Tanacetum cinerariifolium]
MARSNSYHNGWTWIFGKNKHHQTKPIDNPYVKDVEKIATSFFVTNFSNSLDAKNLWKEFQPFGRIVDAFIANKRSKQGKRFGFVIFLGIHEEVFPKSLSNVWIGSYHVFVSVTKFQRNPIKPHASTQQLPKASHDRPTFNTNNLPPKRSYASVTHAESRNNLSQQSKLDNIKSIQLNDDDLILVKDSSTVVLIKFSSVNSCEAFKSNESLNKLWTFIKVPSPSFVVDERVIWIEVSGLPLFILFGDLNEVRNDSERFGSIFSSEDAAIFNNFIQESGLIDLPMGGRSFTWMNKVGSKMRKLERILHSWFDHIDFEKVVKDKWDDITGKVLGQTKSLHTKLKDLKSHLKIWYSHTKEVKTSRMNLLLADMQNLDQKIDEGLASDEDKSSRISKLQELDYFEKMNSLDIMQKARVKWEVEGDENSKFFHGLINSRRKSQLIHGIMHEGDLLEVVVSIEEIKTPVWDCGNNKAPGPDGYSFLFIKRFWDLLKHDIQDFVVSFFSSGKFPQGVNSAFITLIPKVSNPLFIKDYRPISLIGLNYKIVDKSLMVLSYSAKEVETSRMNLLLADMRILDQKIDEGLASD